MFVKLNAAAIFGVSAVPVEVEVDMQKGQTAFTIVGLPDVAVREARERIHSAMKNAGFSYPFNFRVTVNLAPADVEKSGTAFDVPMAAGLTLVSNNVESVVPLSQIFLIGELALDSTIRSVPGVLPLVYRAAARGLTQVFVPAGNAAEASVVSGVTVFPLTSLSDLMAHLSGERSIAPYTRSGEVFAETAFEAADFAHIHGQAFAKRALEVAAAGGHNVLMSGPPGSGKTMLAKALPSILPPLSSGEAFEVATICSVAGSFDASKKNHRPFRSPHHTASVAALVGGGRVPRPGEITLAHRGVLFLDELPEFPRAVLESLRQPLEDGAITVARAQGAVTFPARFMLVASQNPCPCGFATDPERACVCTPVAAEGYMKKVSGPLLDRIDMTVEVPRLRFQELSYANESEPSAVVRERVVAARSIQAERYIGLPYATNAEAEPRAITEACALEESAAALIRLAMEREHLSARAYYRVLKVSRTIADLAGSEKVGEEHVAEALQFRVRG